MSASTVRGAIQKALTTSAGAKPSITLEEARRIIEAAKVEPKGPAKLTKDEAALLAGLAGQSTFEGARCSLTPGAKKELDAFLAANGVAPGPTPHSGALHDLVPAEWRKALAQQLAQPSFQGLEAMLAAEEKAGKVVFPPKAQIFAALEETPPAKVRVVVIGQDPYPTAGNANGLAFSVSPGMKVPASLKNLYAGLQADVGLAPPKTGDLTPWAKQGVLLLNTVLTVREGEPNSHRGAGWEPFTEAVLKKVAEEPGPVVFLCLGAQAKAMAEKIVDPSKHTILAAPHPSPLNGRKFVDAAARDKIFSRTNEILSQGGRGTIDWKI